MGHNADCGRIGRGWGSAGGFAVTLVRRWTQLPRFVNGDEHAAPLWLERDSAANSLILVPELACRHPDLDRIGRGEAVERQLDGCPRCCGHVERTTEAAGLVKADV